MNKVVITITESDVQQNWMVKEGNVVVEVHFEPPVTDELKKDPPLTHTAAMTAINAICDEGVGEPRVTTRPPDNIEI